MYNTSSAHIPAKQNQEIEKSRDRVNINKKQFAKATQQKKKIVNNKNNNSDSNKINKNVKL